VFLKRTRGYGYIVESYRGEDGKPRQRYLPGGYIGKHASVEQARDYHCAEAWRWIDQDYFKYEKHSIKAARLSLYMREISS